MKFCAYENGCEVELDPKEKEGYIDYVQKKNPKKIIKYISKNNCSILINNTKYMCILWRCFSFNVYRKNKCRYI